MADHSMRDLLAERLAKRLDRLGLRPSDLTDDLDLVRSGVLDSLGFVDLIADLETATGERIDLERALEHRNATTVAGIMAIFDRT